MADHDRLNAQGCVPGDPSSLAGAHAKPIPDTLQGALTRRRLLSAAAIAGVAIAVGWLARPAKAGESKELVVFAAASLREVFQSLASSFEKEHAGAKVRLSFAGSQELRVQIEHGAQIDVFASADEKHMAALERAKLVQAPSIFAYNEPVLVVPADNPAKIASLADLPRAQHLVIGTPDVPIGSYTETVLANADKIYGPSFHQQVLARVSSRELNVKQILAKIMLGEGDAGVVYKTDALTAKDRVVVIAIPEAAKVTARYPVAVLAAAPHPDLAKQWVAALLAKPGQQLLAAAGFVPAGLQAKPGK